ncbi:MAG TPA: sialate O-acetylesterase, partial [Candidatus Sulfotelmatobacter sp.]|nr:sialate O-acetylesterase [Candidatus Sulfotelmatobacter sp.]
MARIVLTLCWAGLLSGGMGVPLWAGITPGCLFSEGVVLQQGVAVPVWGTAKNGETVTVTFQGQVVSTTAKGGYWVVELQPLQAGGPFTMVLAGENQITLDNVLVGEVWLCSGQSNMRLPLYQTANAKAAIAAASDSQLRFFTVPVQTSLLPCFEPHGVWKAASPTTAMRFSAVAYYFGRDLRQVRNVPVGLIQASAAGTPIVAWNSRATSEANPKSRLMLQRCVLAVSPPAVGKAANSGSAVTQPACRYNGMIAPLQPFALAGVIWYQGESDAGHPDQYRVLFPALIRNWRLAWGQGDFPFLFVQAAPWVGTPPTLREAQLLTWETVRNTAMVVTTDVGDRVSLHPPRKEPVGARLALTARALAYGEVIEYSGPVYDSLTIEGKQAILGFTHVGSGLVAQGGELKGFVIAGENGRFVKATAEIAGNTVVVSSPAVPHPVAVRYGWSN